jgi:acyl carrier protein
MNKEDIKKRILTTLTAIDINLDENIELSSLDLIAAAVNLERAFGIQFDLDEITLKNFKTLDTVADLILSKI